MQCINRVLGEAITCSTWPNDEKYGCDDTGQFWKSLDDSLNTSQTSSCERLCIQQREDGCCWLGNDWGCQWVGGSGVSSEEGDDAISVKCSKAGI